MAYVTPEMLYEFAGKVPDETATMPARYIQAAEETIAKYLRYSPEREQRTVTVWGDGTATLVLPAPAAEISSVTINGTAQEPDGWEWRKNYLSRRLPNGQLEIFSTDQRVEVEFAAGYDPVPLKIVTCALQLATLYWESAGGNLAVSSTSYADTGTRVFNNFKEDRFLEEINEWRVYNV